LKQIPESNDASPAAATSLRALFRWPIPLALIWLLAPVVGLSLRLALAPITPHDYWWSLAMGNLIASGAGIPHENLFLYTMPADAPFFNQPWLSQLMMAKLLDNFGHAGLLILRNITTVLTTTALLGLALWRVREPRIVGGLALLAVAAGAPVFAVRTQMFAFLPFMLLLGVLFGVADRRLSRRWLLLLIPLTALWGNLHGTFILVPVLVGLCGGALVVQEWLETRRMPIREALVWGGTSIMTALAALLNPQGVGIYTYVHQLTVVSPVSQSVSEWQPPDISEPYGLLVFLVLVVGLSLLARDRKNLKLYEVALFAATTYLAFGSIRHMFWWAAMMMLVIPGPLSRALKLDDWRESATTGAQGAVHLALAVVMVGGLALSQPGLPVHQTGVELLSGSTRRAGPGKGMIDTDTPTQIMEGMLRDGYPGRIFHSQGVGGYLAYSLATPVPRQVAFVDQRMEMIPESLWEVYFEISGAKDGWQEVLDGYGVRTLLLSPGEQSGLIRAVQADPDWVLVAVDEGHLLFFRADQRDHLIRWR